MHEANDAPAAATGDETGPRSARLMAPIVLVVVAAVFAGYAKLLGHWFYSDDFVHLLNNRDLGWQGFFRFLVFADYGERPWVYWRPGWMLLFQLVYSVAGTAAWPYYLVAMLLHAGASAAVTLVGLRVAGHHLLALAGGLLFALLPTHCEAVAWISATYNVIPAAFCLIVAGHLSWRFANDGGVGRGVAIVLLVAASLTFKEAAYGFPLVFAAACVCARDAKVRRWGPRMFVFTALALLVVWHYTARSKRSAPAADTFGLWSSIAHFAAEYLRGMLPMLPANDAAALAIAGGLALVILVLATPLARFLLLWTAAAFVPYVVLSYGERFAYFVHAPAVLLLVRCSADAARGWRWPRAAGSFALLWICVAVLAGLRLPDALALHRDKSEECRRVQEFVAEHGLDQRPELLVDVLPISLDNGFQAMVRLFGGGDTRVVFLQAIPAPPFLLCLDRAFGDLPGATPVLQLADLAAMRTTTKAELIGGLVLLPVLVLAGDYELVADEAAALAALQRPGCDPAVRPLLYERPPCALEMPGEYRLEVPTMGNTEWTFAVECARPTLLLIASPRPVDLHQRGRVLIDGVAVPVQRANLRYHAVCLSAGPHEVALRPVLDDR